MSREWTKEQRRAIEHEGGDLLVSAAAGSGKTAVLSERCARLVTCGGAGGTSVDRLLVLTFTDAAANEMRGRIAKALRDKLAAAEGRDAAGLARQIAMIDRASISTLHAFCGRTLRSYFHEARIDPAFEILDQDEGDLLRDEVMEEVIARWHRGRKPKGEARNPDERGRMEDADGGDFADFYEGYAQGRDANLKELMRRLHGMLATVKDPAAWLAEAREVYSEAGAVGTRERYMREVAREMALLAGRYERQAGEMGRVEGCEVMAERVMGWCETVRQGAGVILEKGARGWDLAAAAVRGFDWGKNLSTPKGVEGFEGLKKRIYEAAKDDRKKLLMRTFAEEQTAERVLADLRSLAGPLEMLMAMTEDFQREFAAAKRIQNRLDFADLERFTLELLTREGSAAAGDLRQRFDYMLVDEFQDINPLQAALLEAVRDGGRHGGRGNLFVVGDVKQSIYGFRHADPQQFLRRERAAREAAGGQGFLALQHNFRSKPGLLGVLNGVFERLLTLEVSGVDYAAGHVLRAAPEAGERDVEGGKILTGMPVELHVMLTDSPGGEEEESDGAAEGGGNGSASKGEESAAMSATELEAGMVAERIEALMKEGRVVRDRAGDVRPLEYRDIAILLRGVRRRAPLLVRALGERDIPAHADLATGFFDAEEVAYTLAVLTLLDNPLQDIPLVTAMLSPLGRFTHNDLARIRLAYRKKGEVAFHEAVGKVLRGEAAEEEGGQEDAEGGKLAEDATLRPRLQSFFGQLEKWRERVRTIPLHEALAEIYQDAHLLTYVAGLAGGTQRSANLQALHQRALQFSGFRRQGLYRFLRFIERLREADGDFGEAAVLSEASNVVRIMTIHKSKGLEFPVVFVSTLGVNFNLEMGGARGVGGAVVIDRDEHVGMQVADVERNVYRPTAASWLIGAARRRAARAEELRLLYVAMTRARECLILTGAMRQSSFERICQGWDGHLGAMPEDALLRGYNFLEYLVPLAVGGGLEGKLMMTRHEAPRAVGRRAENAQMAGRLGELQEHRPLGAATHLDATVAALVQRLTGRYPQEALTKLPALFSVTELKKRREVLAPEEAGGVDTIGLSGEGGVGDGGEAVMSPQWLHGAEDGEKKIGDGGALARERGIATHRVLEILDFSRVRDAGSLDQFMATQVREGRLAQGQIDAVDREQILWFVASDLGRRIGAAQEMGAADAKGRGKRRAEGSLFEAGERVYRELQFVYRVPAEQALAMAGLKGEEKTMYAAEDGAILRGVIDLLLVENGGEEGVEIVDYKTDAKFFIARHLPGYRLQMQYYARAAEEILGRRVRRATLVFLAAREMVVLEEPGGERRQVSTDEHE